MNKTYYWIAGIAVVILLLVWYMQSSLSGLTASLSASITQSSPSGTASTLVQTPSNFGINAKRVVPETGQGAFRVVATQGVTPPRNATRIANNAGIQRPTIGN